MSYSSTVVLPPIPRTPANELGRMRTTGTICRGIKKNRRLVQRLHTKTLRLLQFRSGKLVFSDLIPPTNFMSHPAGNFCGYTFTRPAFVNGVEIVSMPDGFYTKGGFDGQITNVSSTVNTLDEGTALETLYRLNVGGDMVSDVNDTGMFRRWLPDDDFFISENSATKQILPDVKMHYTDSIPAYVAPEDVHKTYRTMGNSQNPQLNLTWLFKVDAGFTYLVRLHFCETLREVNEPDQRIFTIFIGNQIAKLEMNVISFSRASPTPIYLDFSVYVGFENGLRPDLQLDLHPFKEVPPKFHDAILNGLEILKLNNLDSIAGPHSNIVGESNVASTTRRKRIVITTLIVVGSVVLVASVIVFFIFLVRQIKRRKKSRQNNSVAMFK
ncbi:unnamed protein product, partial [Brassica rapa subsp. trilocularis]